MDSKDLSLIEKYLSTTGNRLRLVDEKLEKEILRLKDLNATGSNQEDIEQAESSYQLVDLQSRAVQKQIESILWKLQYLQEKK